jgi:hypothetical protein
MKIDLAWGHSAKAEGDAPFKRVLQTQRNCPGFITLHETMGHAPEGAFFELTATRLPARVPSEPGLSTQPHMLPRKNR